MPARVLHAVLRFFSGVSLFGQVAPAAQPATMPYAERYRPQFHFTARANWLNDPNGLVFCGGEYHLFFQHNPAGNEWGNMTWGHAVSRDLFHWQQLDHAIVPDAMGTIYSGSAVVDHDNTAGFQTGPEPAIVAIYTAAGGTSAESKGKRFTQCLAYSNDRGRTWTKFTNNPVLPHIVGENRDPKVTWHGPTRRWIMALYLQRNDFALLSSSDLKTWTRLQDLNIPGAEECPDFFEMHLDGDASKPRWVFTAANGNYMVGSFDGKRFSVESGPQPSDFGPNFYAVQSFFDAPGNRRIQIAWMRGGRYPGMPFNQQMSVPCDVTLASTSDGARLLRQPVREIETLYRDSRRLADVDITPTSPDPFAGLTGDCFDLTAEFTAIDAAELNFSIAGRTLTYRPVKRQIQFLGSAMPVHAGAGGSVKLRLIIDRTSLEVFADDGASVLSACFIPAAADIPPLALGAKGGRARITSLEVHRLKSVWPDER